MTLTSTIVGILVSIPIGIGGARNLAPAARLLRVPLNHCHFACLPGDHHCDPARCNVRFRPFAGFLTLTFATIGFIASSSLTLSKKSMKSRQRPSVPPARLGCKLVNYAVQPQVMPRLIGLSLYRLTSISVNRPSSASSGQEVSVQRSTRRLTDTSTIARSLLC
ncbi:hypothetical protein ACFS3B_10180 [Brucella rhizosphaerae]|uniref:hypothetical protein n=1 Tax=Brucella rhizosphaerae TaxID=571254 RepID=UPI00362FB9D2